MSDLGDSLRKWAADIAPYLPPSILGSIIGLRWAKNQTPLQKVASFFMSCAFAVYAGPAIAEWMALGPKSSAAVILMVAVLGMDILGGLVAAAREFGVSPLASFKEWWGAWRGGR